MRLRASSRRWGPHLGHTCRLASNSALKTYCPQPSHFCHNPSMRTLFSAVFGSISFSCRLNQDMYSLPPLVPGGVNCFAHERPCPDSGAYSYCSRYASDFVQPSLVTKLHKYSWHHCPISYGCPSSIV